ncbi:hypothetical protein LGW64_09805, partial [Streptococcus mutans]|nr:hypothetical protein [Streptococcus mutans]
MILKRECVLIQRNAVLNLQESNILDCSVKSVSIGWDKNVPPFYCAVVGESNEDDEKKAIQNAQKANEDEKKAALLKAAHQFNGKEELPD